MRPLLTIGLALVGCKRVIECFAEYALRMVGQVRLHG